MPRGSTLQEIVEMTKAELLVDSDSDVASGGDSVLMMQIANQQRWLAAHYTFSDLVIRREITLAPGTRYYNFPVTEDDVQEFDLGKKIVAECYWSHLWNLTEPGIRLRDYNALNPELNVRVDPVRRWQKYRPAGSTVPMFEVWPLPASGTQLRLTGQMHLPPLVEADDMAELDDLLLAQWTAAKLLARMKSADAPAMLAEAQKTLQAFIGGDNSPSQVFSLIGSRFQRRGEPRTTVAVNYSDPVRADNTSITADYAH
jgi:hypothetical protein